MSRITGYDHTSFTVKDIDRTVGFWTQTMGFELNSLSPRTQPWLGEVVGEPGATCRIAHLAGHGMNLEFIDYDGKAPGENVFGPATRAGAAHIAFHVDDIAGFSETMLTGGATMLGQISRCGSDAMTAGCLAVYMKDPEGIIVELVEDLPANP
jgi:catechol 2,3-dioxygenase-like lactoylglutathione lyase family enzyme